MINMIQKMVQEKKDYRDYKNRVNQLPEQYKKAMNAIEKYMWNYAKGSGMFEHIKGILEMFESGVSEGLTVREVVGNDLADFADGIIAEIPEETWIHDMRKKLRSTLE